MFHSFFNIHDYLKKIKKLNVPHLFIPIFKTSVLLEGKKGLENARLVSL